MSLNELLRKDEELYKLFLNDGLVYNGLRSDTDLEQALINTIKALGNAYNSLFKRHLECQMKCPQVYKN